MKWGIISETFPPDVCGAAAFAARLGEHLTAEGENVWVLTRPGPVEPFDVQIAPILRGQTYVAAVHRWSRQQQPDVLVMNYAYSDVSVYRHNISSALLTWVMAREVPVLGIFHEIPQLPITRRNIRAHLREMVTLPGAAAVVVPDYALLRGSSAIVRALASLGRRCLELPVPANIDCTDEGPDPQYEEFSAGIFGVVKPHKGLEFALTAFSEADRRIVVVGGGEAPYLKLLRETFGGSAGHCITGWLPESMVSRVLQTVPHWILPFLEDGCSFKSTSWAVVRLHGGHTITTHRFRSGYSPELNTTFIPWNERFHVEAWIRAVSGEHGRKFGLVVPTWRSTAQMLIRVANGLVRSGMPRRAVGGRNS